ncbi:hypothetical protein EMIHUDRAFT_108856 [Emiliania huxleyi CCMP1516]|uniref:C3H1-type domain-containing protein n=2 Tax=Emiliania huxleyi TaxID=2903 RepID=A0A0D3KVU7_EMIH1|nr:hypothetical protein EMIHUDRAFT_108856 [Emiliania huxleyi CCMP1516]EOD39882.1 hypothetical protein EMIHUDRAFT_108856 [Emiliania huxleyi CCMP1516]|eukprot:XP_005792311.1 hypothetical protein EMIHUDRAFT_108856 [Emiliania huxleyi CCMP1516]
MRPCIPPLLLLVLCAAAAARRLTVVPQPALTDAETGAFTVNASVVVPRFDPGPKALDFLRREGYVVIRDVLNASDLALARRLFWAFVEGAGASSADPASWRRALSPNQYGIAWGLGAGQSRLMWHVRTRPRLLQMFALVWGTDDLLTSFEAFSLLPPREAEAGWSLAESWFHTDQNGRSRPGLQTVQSFTSLWPQDERSGAFVVVPRGAFVVVPQSHARHEALTRRVYAARPGTSDEQQFLMVPSGDRLLATPHPPHLVRCGAWRDAVGAGDAVLWDSRTVHCNTPPLLAGGGEAARAAEARGGEAAEAEAAEAEAAEAEAAEAVMGAEEEAGQEIEGRRPGRVVAYASFAPRSRADSRTVVQRQRAFASGQTCTHWPFEMTCLEPPQAVGEPAVIARDPKAKCANGSGCKYIHDGTGATPTPTPADPLADRIAAAKAAIAPGTPPSLGKRAKPPTPDSSDDL